MAASGLRLVFAPGFMCDGRVFSKILAAEPALAEARIASFDAESAIETMAQRLLDENAGPLMIVGHSMGASVAMEAARRDPRVRALFLISANSQPEAAHIAAGRGPLLEALRREGLEAVLTQAFLPLYWGAKPPIPEITETVLAMAATLGPEVFARQVDAVIARPDPRPTVAAFAGPLWAMTGALDSLTFPALGQELATLAPRGRFLLDESSAHFTPLESAQRVAAAILAARAEAAQE